MSMNELTTIVQLKSLRSTLSSANLCRTSVYSLEITDSLIAVGVQGERSSWSIGLAECSEIGLVVVCLDLRGEVGACVTGRVCNPAGNTEGNVLRGAGRSDCNCAGEVATLG